MNRFRWTGFLLVAIACSQASAPHPPTPAPTPTPSGNEPKPETERGIGYALSARMRYTFYRRDSVVIQMPSGEVQLQNTGRTAFLSLTLVPNGSEARLAVTLDSIRPDPDVYIPPASLDSATRTQWTGRFLRDGRLSDLVATQKSWLGEQVGDQLSVVFPILPPEGVRVGAIWSDSSTRRLKVGAIETTETGLTQYAAPAAESYAGVSAIRIESTLNATLWGAGNELGQELSGTSSDWVVYHMALDGRMLGGSGTESADMTITVTDVGQVVPTRKFSRFSFEAIGQ